jgi:hypothetical protein
MITSPKPRRSQVRTLLPKAGMIVLASRCYVYAGNRASKLIGSRTRKLFMGQAGSISSLRLTVRQMRFDGLPGMF